MGSKREVLLKGNSPPGTSLAGRFFKPHLPPAHADLRSVKMASHQTPDVQLPFGLGANFGHGLEKALPVGIVLENGFAAVTPVHHVVDGSGYRTLSLRPMQRT